MSRPVIHILAEDPDHIPIQGYEGDAGFDLRAVDTINIPKGEYASIHTGIKMAMPPDVWCMIVGRSSSLRMGIRVEPAIIDPNYRGPMSVVVQAVSDVTLDKGTRIAQILFFSRISPEWEPVEALPTSNRGERGFGSSGRS